MVSKKRPCKDFHFENHSNKCQLYRFSISFLQINKTT